MQVVTSQLADIARQVNAENAALADGLKGSLERAARIGRLLLEAKAIVPHGGFVEWVGGNTTVGIRQAQKYMTLAKANPNSLLAQPTIDSAYVAIQRPKKVERRATGPKTKAAKQRIEAIKEAATVPYTVATMRAALRAMQSNPDAAMDEIELIEELRDVCEQLIERATARPAQAA